MLLVLVSLCKKKDLFKLDQIQKHALGASNFEAVEVKASNKDAAVTLKLHIPVAKQLQGSKSKSSFLVLFNR